MDTLVFTVSGWGAFPYQINLGGVDDDSLVRMGRTVSDTTVRDQWLQWLQNETRDTGGNESWQNVSIQRTVRTLHAPQWCASALVSDARASHVFSRTSGAARIDSRESRYCPPDWENRSHNRINGVILREGESSP